MNNKVVVDANIAVKWAITEEDSDRAEALLVEWNRQKKSMLAPALFVYEITNILLQKVRRGEITLTRAQQAASFILDTGVEIYWPINPDLPINALHLAHEHKLPATYDAHYLAYTELEQCEFWTADKRLYNSVKDKLSWVRLMADYQPTTTSIPTRQFLTESE